MRNSGDYFAAGCGGCLGVLISTIIWAVINFTLVIILWNWLMPDLFELPKISLFQAIGISLLLGLLRSSSDNQSNQIETFS